MWVVLTTYTDYEWVQEREDNIATTLLFWRFSKSNLDILGVHKGGGKHVSSINVISTASDARN
jgi:hypothetical protein